MYIRFLSLILALAFFSACSGEGGDSAANSTQKAEIEKWNLYVDFGNHLETDFNQALSGYFKAFGNFPDYKPADRSDYIADFIEAMGADQTLSKDIERALALAQGSDSELDQVTYEMSLQLEALWTRLRLARDYHAADGGDPADDERARQLHREIFESYLGLESSYSRFRHILNKSDAERRHNDLKEMRDKGLILWPAMLQLIDDAQAVQDMLLARGISAETLAELRPEELQPYCDQVLKSQTELEEAFKQVDKPGKEGLSDQSLPRFRDQAKRMVDSLNLFAEGLRLQDASSPSDQQNIPNTPEKFAQELGILIDIYNESVH